MLADLRHSDARQLESLLLHVYSLTSSGVKANVLDWLEDNVIYPHSDKRPNFERDFYPWFNEPLEAFASGEYRVISFVGPTGCGKTSFLEALTCYAIAQDPGHTLIVGQSDDDVTKWAETRLMPMLEKVKAVAALFPARAYSKRKTEIIFPHMPLYLGGANINNLQSASCRYVWCDEVWTFKKGMVKEAKARLHDRSNGVFICMGQAGLEDDEHYEIHETCAKHEFSWRCPSCEKYNAYSAGPEQLKFTESRNEHGELDRAALERSVRLCCPQCNAEFLDNEYNRKMLAMSAKYLPIESNAWSGRIGYHMHILAVWDIDKCWTHVAAERVEAIEHMRVGDLTGMRIFRQKREAEFWTDAESVPRIQLQTGGYAINDYSKGEEIDNERIRFFSIDRQATHFWGAIRAWRSDGSSRLLWADKITDQSMILDLCKQYNVFGYRVCIDTRYDKAEMRAFCQRNGFLPLLGDNRDSWSHPPDKKGDASVRKPYSPLESAITIEGLPLFLVYFSTLHIKDTLNLLRMGKFRAFEVPRDISSVYALHMESEIKKNVATENAEPNMRWRCISHRDNHLWDCEAMNVCMAIMAELIQLDENFQVRI